MVFVESIKDQVDIEELVRELRPRLRELPPIMRSSACGGWALQGTTTSYRDGWDLKFCPYNGPHNRGPSWHPSSPLDHDLRPIQDFKVPTDANTPSTIRLLDRLERLGLVPRRARIIKLCAQSKMTWHVDGNPRTYQVRLHIPLVTNPECFFDTDNGSHHMAADGSFHFVHVNRFHRARNDGSADRFHFVCNVWDTMGFTRDHRYEWSKYDFEADHPAPGDSLMETRPE